MFEKHLRKSDILLVKTNYLVYRKWSIDRKWVKNYKWNWDDDENYFKEMLGINKKPVMYESSDVYCV